MFEAGFARLDITPPLGTPLTGYYKSRYADGVLDPLELNAVAIFDGEKTLLILAADLILIDEACSTEIREKVSADTSVPADHIMVHCLHQHTAPHVGKTDSIPLVDYLKDAAYLDVLYRKFSDAAKMAISDLRPATLSTAAKDTAEPLSFIRRYRMKDGSTRTNPGYMNPDIDYPLGKADNSVRLIRMQREGADSIALVAFSTHQDTVGGTKFSADWGGAFRRQAEERMCGVKAVVLSGFQGDVNHCNFFKPAPYSKDDPDFLEKRYAFTRNMGKVLTDTLVEMWDQTEPVQGEKVWAKMTVKRVPTNQSGIERADECWEIYQKSMNHTLGYKLEMGEKADMGRIGTLPKCPICQKVVVTLFGMGNAAILGVGGEPFTQYALSAREAAKDLFLITACLTNGAEAYFPTEEAYAEGGYEARTSRMGPECAPVLKQTNLDILTEYGKIKA